MSQEKPGRAVEYDDATRIGPGGQSVILKSANGYKLYKTGTEEPLLPDELDNEFSFSLFNLQWSLKGEKIYFFIKSVPYMTNLQSGDKLELAGNKFITDFRLAAGWDGEKFYCLKYDASSKRVLLVRYE